MKPFYLLVILLFVSCSTTQTSQPVKTKQLTSCFVTSDDLDALLTGEDLMHLKNKYYDVVYNNKRSQPDLVEYKMKYSKETHTLNRGVDFTNRFKVDPRVTRSADDKSYLRSGWQKGHLAPAEDFSFEVEAATDTFLYSNVSPQYPSFNMHGSWVKLEKKVRSISESGLVQVLTGPLMFDGRRTNENDNSPEVPTVFFKAIVSDSDNRCEVSIFVLKNDKSSKDYCEDNVYDSFKDNLTLKRVTGNRQLTNAKFCEITSH
ncbi:MAG: DNA/RNA non-specific endonuclease [Bacteriovoracaceae bacterium]|nr:DNA/RNA non-specific endonuclease [Bacteriovoracaceae bacterium]